MTTLEFYRDLIKNSASSVGMRVYLMETVKYSELNEIVFPSKF